MTMPHQPTTVSGLFPSRRVHDSLWFFRARILRFGLTTSVSLLSACSVQPVRHPVAPAVVAAPPSTAQQAESKAVVSSAPSAKPVAESQVSATEPHVPLSDRLPASVVQARVLPSDIPSTQEPEGARPSEQGPPLAIGLTSWYGKRFHGRRTASGEVFDMHALTAAHRSLPFGTLLRVRSVITGREVVVRINDRGPFRGSRMLDLSLGAARALGVDQMGVTRVEIRRE
jgi:rare lipoprotein A